MSPSAYLPMKHLRIALLFALFVSLVIGCTSREHSYRDHTTKIPIAGSATDLTLSRNIRRMPWELWAHGRDLEGTRIADISIARGDDMLRQGKRSEALVEYQEALKGRLSPAVSRALTFRIAAEQLSLDTAEAALVTLSTYFRSQGQGVAQVSPRFALLFGYAYGRNGDFDQSISWFSRAHDSSGPSESIGESATLAIDSLLVSIPSDKLDAASGQWKNNLLISAAIGRERGRRQNVAGAAAGTEPRPFAALFYQKLETGTSVAAATTTAPAAQKIGMLVPLSGQYGNLGSALKNGVDLALAGASSAGAVPAEYIYRDTNGNPAEAVSQARQLLEVEGVRAIIGPLLAEEGLAVSDLARTHNVPIIAFSKRSDFPLGDYVFRLAPTAEAQIESLVEAAAGIGLKRFGIVYVDDTAGREFAGLFRQRIISRGLTVSYESSYPKDQLDPLIERAKELEKTGVDAVFFPDSLAQAAHFFSSVAESVRRRIRPLGLANWDSSQELLNSAGALEGALFVSPFFRESTRPIVTQFISAYKQRYGLAPDFLAAQGFDASTMLLAALAREQQERVSLVAALKGIDTYDGLTGRIILDQRGEFVRKFSVIELREGRVAEMTEVGAPPAPRL